jgi:hydroxyethylthiazole kinase-like uncharacterized protein yjeF
MYVLTAAEMQACDRLTGERFGISSLQLMRNAAAAVASFAREQFPQARRFTVLCGRGNNGGDGMMAARLLSLAGMDVAALLLGDPERLADDAAEAWSELAAAPSVTLHVVREAADLAHCKAALETDLIVDAVVGTGFVPPLRGLALAALEWVAGSKAPILAVDLPSGWPADGASPAATCLPADAAITFTAPKPAHVFDRLTRRWDQPVVVAPIGSPDEAIEAVLGPKPQRIAWAGAAMERVQTPRAVAANKGEFGHVLVVGGTFGSAGGKAGAPAMAALAAMRVGAGLVTAAVPAPALGLVAAVAPELMTWPLAATAAGEIAAANLNPEKLAALTAGKRVLVVGPGIGQAPETAEFVLGVLSASQAPVVIDADALNILAANPARLDKLAALDLATPAWALEADRDLQAWLATNPPHMARRRTVVLTPHPGEMARLTGLSVAEIQANRLNVAREFAMKYGAILVLKGARTLIAHPDGRVAVNTTGNPGMAKGGSGDLLAGTIGGLLAQYPAQPGQAVEAAVYLHGLAADLAVRDGDEHTLLATDSLACLSRAFRFRARRPNGYVWLQGLPAESLAATREATS